MTPWCCTHKKLLYYYAVCLTVISTSAVLELAGVIG